MAKTTVLMLLISGINVGLVLTTEMNWIQAMRLCVHYNQAPTLQGDSTSGKIEWVGKARYNMSLGVFTIQIEEKRRNEKTCFGILLDMNETILFPTSKKGKYCSHSLAELMKNYLFNDTGAGNKCTFADYTEQTIKHLPTPTDCLVTRGNSSEYVSCDMKREDGCKKIRDNSLELSITLSFTDARGGLCVKDNEKCSGRNSRGNVVCFENLHESQLCISIVHRSISRESSDSNSNAESDGEHFF